MAARWRALRTEIANALAAGGVANAGTEARFMVEEASGTTAAEWVDIADVTAPERAESRLRRMCERRIQGEPLQYVLGAWSFRGLDLMVDARVLIPRPETEWIVEVALDEAERIGLRRVRKRPPVDRPIGAWVADLGTGSGAIALALEAALSDVEVWATDASEDALAVASANVAGCAASRVRIGLGSWFDALPPELRGRLSMIVTNPPYVAASEVPALPPEVRDHEPRGALVSGPTGLEALERIIDHAPEWLATPSVMVCEIAPHQAGAVVDRARVAGFRDAFVRADLAERPRVLVARRD